ncbi:MAG: NADH-quinone oxidoreductase subunit E [Dehalococcoidia bacterium]|nr:NADH-quinone oxidoreductase subunit E [Dehalococcoidia bacterium]
MPLETEASAELRALVADLRPDDADLLEALHRVQHRYGYVSRSAMHVIAEQLKLSPAHVFGTTTYYEDFRTTPPAQTTVAWCSGPACWLRNGAGVRDAMLAVLGVRMAEQTADGRVEVVVGQCNGTCEQAPQVWVNERVVGRLTAASAVRLARGLRDGADAAEVGRDG